MKYIRISSDLHLEGFYGTLVEKLADHFLPADDRDSESVLVLAGDVSSKPDQLAQFVKAVENRFIKVICVLGNHEYYKHTYNDLPEKVAAQFAAHGVENTVCPGNFVKSYKIDGVNFIAGTLWGECSHDPSRNAEIEQMINDFRLIKIRDSLGNYRNMSAADMRRISGEHAQLIRNELARPSEGVTVVITHHLPTYDAVSVRFKVSTINGAFVCPMDDLWEPSERLNLWLFGHTHDHVDFIKDGIRFVANPVGYRGEWGTSYNAYNSHQFIEI